MYLEGDDVVLPARHPWRELCMYLEEGDLCCQPGTPGQSSVQTGRIIYHALQNTLPGGRGGYGKGEGGEAAGGYRVRG